MTRFNPDFWEVVVERAQLEAYSNEDALWHWYNQPSPSRDERAKRTRKTFEQIRALMHSELTVRQREVVELCYFAQLTQQEIAERLGIAQQVVGQHLLGIVRNGKRVGGAIPRLQKLCEERGIEW
jgi:RNA polymerase sigma factor (sigma-70 family)